MTSTVKKILAVVVTYHPEPDLLCPLLRALSHQVAEVLVVDNTPGESTSAEEIVMPLATADPKIRMVRCGMNLGVGVAHNIGIEAALSQGFDYVLISDQDSLPAADMVEKLLEGFAGNAERNVKVAATCPAYLDEVTGQLIPFQVAVQGRCFYRSKPIDADTSPSEVLTFISSGSLMDCEAVRQIGGLHEDLFIDHIDTEWCHRAREYGFSLLGMPQARLIHRLGDNDFRVWAFRWRRYTDYSPLRLYYRYRNFVRLLWMPHINFCWKVRASWYWLGDFYAHMVFSKNRPRKLRMILLGLRDGLRGSSGPTRRIS
jgi:rhamnosyltransferase